MLAEEKGLDLVEIAATATPPVCRIMNSGKFFYQQSKRESEARKHQRHIQVKEVKFRPKIDEHDFQFKRRNVERFLNGGNKVKSVVIFRGREVVHMEVGRRHLERLAEELSDLCNVESPPKKEGNTMVQILSPKKDAATKKAVAAKKEAEAKKGDAKKKGKKDEKAAKKADAKKPAEKKAPKKTEETKAPASDAAPAAKAPTAAAAKAAPAAEAAGAKKTTPAAKAAGAKKTAKAAVAKAPSKTAEAKPAAAAKAAKKPAAKASAKKTASKSKKAAGQPAGAD